ncbi:MAG: PIG-L deacetylase family protein [Candidatus Hodarchaeota archaeon]
MNERKVIVTVYAHPDDGEFFAGGTLAKWANEGHQVYVICVTDGSLGTRLKDISAKELIKTRQEELKCAMKVIGGNPPIFLGFPDGFVRKNISQLKERLVYWFRKLKPDRIITFDPWKTYQIHPDHIEVGRIASEAAVFTCFPLLYPEHLQEGLEPHQPEEVWFMTPTEHKPNRLIDITQTLDQKLEALFCHHSQLAMLADMFIEGADPTNLSEEDKNQLREGVDYQLRMLVQGIGMLSEGKVEYAEGFYAVKIGAGHFDNYPIMLQEALGMDPDPLIIM